MHSHEYMIGCIWLHVAYILILCRLHTSLYVRLHSYRFDYMYQYCRLVTRIDCLCILMVACGNAYNGVMVVFMHEVMVCVVDMVMNQ